LNEFAATTTIPETQLTGSGNRSPRRTPAPARWFITACLALLTIAFASGGASAQLLAKKTLSLAAAKKMAAAAEAEAAKNKWAMVIAVLDDGGHLIYLEHMDGAQIGSIEVAQGKARTAVRFRRPSKDFEDAVAASHLNVITLGDITAIRGGLAGHARRQGDSRDRCQRRHRRAGRAMRRGRTDVASLGSIAIDRRRLREA
jgi:glc operon protein GlcG